MRLGQVHVLLDGHRIKTLPSRLDVRDLARLAAGARWGMPHIAAIQGEFHCLNYTTDLAIPNFGLAIELEELIR